MRHYSISSSGSFQLISENAEKSQTRKKRIPVRFPSNEASYAQCVSSSGKMWTVWLGYFVNVGFVGFVFACCLPYSRRGYSCEDVSHVSMCQFRRGVV